jgi:hypothetical protein
LRYDRGDEAREKLEQRRVKAIHRIKSPIILDQSLRPEPENGYDEVERTDDYRLATPHGRSRGAPPGPGRPVLLAYLARADKLVTSDVDGAVLRFPRPHLVSRDDSHFGREFRADGAFLDSARIQLKMPEISLDRHESRVDSGWTDRMHAGKFSVAARERSHEVATEFDPKTAGLIRVEGSRLVTALIVFAPAAHERDAERKRRTIVHRHPPRARPHLELMEEARARCCWRGVEARSGFSASVPHRSIDERTTT